MLSRFALTAAILLWNCGPEPLLGPGVYSVTHTIVFSTDPFAAAYEGQSFEAAWSLHDEHRLEINRGTVLRGGPVDQEWVFSNEGELWGQPCPFYYHLWARLVPEAPGKFTGQVAQVYDFCTEYREEIGITAAADWVTEFDVVGHIK